jgi:tRNA (mo5U34)-methyltransferase
VRWGDNKRRGASTQAAVDGVPFWWHSIDLGNGVVTPGRKGAAQLAEELATMQLPDLHGKTVLDIGAWDGYFSFAAERLGAAVTAFDYFEWSTDTDAKMRYWQQCMESGEEPQPYRQVPGLWAPDTLPGKGGFNTAKSVLGSTVNEVIADFTTVDLDQLGQFDVVFFLGVLYHLHEPFDALKRLAAITREVAIIETAALATPEFAPDRGLFEFFPGAELNGDPTNWWAPNLAGLIGACRAAGFTRMVPTVPEPETAGHYRITLQAWK